jgi:hypothetical protein
MGRAEGEARMTPLERHTRWLLRCYPVGYRQERGEEIIGTLLEASPDGWKWPRARDVRALAVGGLKARAAQNRQRTAGANLRVAVMAGLAIYLSLWIANYLAGVVQGLASNFAPLYQGWSSWAAAVAALLTGATIVLAWMAPRTVVLTVALASAASVVYFGLTLGGPHLLSTRVLELLALAGLAGLSPRRGHPSRHWLWLPGLIAVSAPLLQLAVSDRWLGYPWQLWWQLPLFVVIVCSIFWVAVDARLMIAVLTLFAFIELELPVEEISSGSPGGFVASLPLLGVGVAIAAPAVWLLRRQSARPVR